MLASLGRRLRRIGSRSRSQNLALPSTIIAELYAMGAIPADMALNGNVLPPIPGETARARILARHGHLAYINTNH